MKKLASLILTFILLIMTVFTATSCSFFKNPIDRFKNKLKESDNHTITCISELPTLGTMRTTQKIVGTTGHTFISLQDYSESYYVGTINGETYIYTYNEKTKLWESSKQTDGSYDDYIDYSEIYDFLDPDNLEKVEGSFFGESTYKQKTDADFDYENCSNLTITVSNDKCTIEFDVDDGNTTCCVKYIISDIGSTTINIPDDVFFD